MKQFSDFGITVESKAFTGDKIKMSKILNKEIEVIDFDIKDSKFPEKGNGKCLYIQIKLKSEMHIVFTGSGVLMDQLKKVPEGGMPFMATIINENESYKFT